MQQQKAGLTIEDANQIIDEIETKHGVREFFKQIRSLAGERSISGWDGTGYGFGNLRTNYDMAKMQPSEQHYKDYLEARKIITDCGLDLE